jgi:TadE-like protein
MNSASRSHGPKRHSLGRSGVAAIEYAIVLPIFLAMVFGIIEISRMIWVQVTLERATAVAARCGAVAGTGCASNALVATKASQSAPALSIPSSAFTVVHETCGVRVTGKIRFSFVTGLVGLADRDLTATFCHPVTA